MFSEEKVDDWAKVLDEGDFPHVYFITFATFVCTIFSLILPWFLASFVINHAIVLIPEENRDFVMNHYMPELHNATKNISIPHEDQKELVFRFIGVLIKIGWAFVWQEDFVPLPFLYNEFALPIGAKLTPDINDYSARISKFPQTDKNVNTSHNVYPGDWFCRNYSPHALWHEESANGLLELVFLSDFVNKILGDAKERDSDSFLIE